MKPRFSKLSAFIFSAIALTACGGGGGGSGGDSNNNNDDTGREESVYLSFHVLDGDIENAYVYADLNRNYQWDSEKEPRARTDSRGLVTLDIAKKELNETGDTRLLIIAAAGSGARDHVYSSETALTAPFTMSRNVYVNRQTPNGTTFIISPFSTLADITAGDDSDSETEESYLDRMGSAAELAGGLKSLVSLDAGYNKDCTDSADFKTLIAGELLARKGVLPETDQDLRKLGQNISDVSELAASLADNKALANYVYYRVIADISEDGLINKSRDEIAAVITGYLRNIPDLPADESDKTDDDDSGNTGNDDSGNTSDDDSGNTGNDDSGNTGDDDSGNTGNDDSGNTGDDDSGNTGDDDSGNTGDDDSGNTGDDDSGNTGDDDSGNTGDDDSGNTRNDDSGNSGDDDSGNTGDDDSGNNEEPPAPEPTYVEITNHNLNFNYVQNEDTAILSDLDGKADVAGGREEYFSFTPHTESAVEIMGVKYGSVRVYSDGTYRYYVPYAQLNNKSWRDYSESVVFSVNGKVYTKTFDLVQDPLFDQQDHLRNAGRFIGSKAGEDLNAVPAWQKGYTGQGVTVAIIDSEFQIGHEDLRDNFIPELCYSADLQSSDQEDLMLTAISGTTIHGTPVAGVIAATAFNGVGSRGVAYNARMYGLTNANRAEYYYENSIIGKADIVNESFGSATPALLLGNTDLVDALTENHIPIVKAAGNNFTATPVTDIGTGVCVELGVNCVFAQTDYQTKAPGSIMVGAVEHDGTHAYYSSGGTNLWISARTGALTTDVEGCTYNMESQIIDSGTCNYGILAGTSIAAPAATGVTALILEAGDKNLTVNQVKYILAKTAVNYKSDSAMQDSDVSGDSYVIHKGWIPTRNSSRTGLYYSTLFGFGRIDAGAATELAANCSEDADCARRSEDPVTLTTSENKCILDTSLTTASEFVYTCSFTDLTDEDGNPYQSKAQIENTYLDLDTYKLSASGEKFGNSYNQTAEQRVQAMRTASLTQMELLVNGDESRKSIIKQRYEFIERVYDPVMSFTTQASYLDEIAENDEQIRYTLRIRSPEAIDTNTLKGRIRLNVYPLEE
ncbi:MAG: S8 family serine peptidase [Succinimonas sp.]|nr:S8 family serine peptidase [Succinimonas sp.]